MVTESPLLTLGDARPDRPPVPIWWGFAVGVATAGSGLLFHRDLRAGLVTAGGIACAATAIAMLLLAGRRRSTASSGGTHSFAISAAMLVVTGGAVCVAASSSLFAVLGLRVWAFFLALVVAVAIVPSAAHARRSGGLAGQLLVVTTTAATLALVAVFVMAPFRLRVAMLDGPATDEFVVQSVDPSGCDLIAPTLDGAGTTGTGYFLGASGRLFHCAGPVTSCPCDVGTTLEHLGDGWYLVRAAVD